MKPALRLPPAPLTDQGAVETRKWAWEQASKVLCRHCLDEGMDTTRDLAITTKIASKLVAWAERGELPARDDDRPSGKRIQ